ncbi:MAG: DNA-binding beta-propeller fold protein YncE [Verrucomicrobia bacterium]|nr:DNA-binding beta-propeller fold protein YncE [Verrucomicrobiota bacterium]
MATLTVKLAGIFLVFVKITSIGRASLARFLLTMGAVTGIACVSPASALEKPPLKRVATTPMPDVTGDFEHFAVDLKGNRLFLAAEEKKTVEVFDLRTGARIHSISGFGLPHFLHYLSDSNRLFVTDEGVPEGPPGAVQVVDCADYKIVNSIKLPPGAEQAVFNPVNRCYYVQTGPETPGGKTHLLNVIDLKTLALVGTITLPGEANKGMVIDGKGRTLYVNLFGSDEVGVVDLDTRQLTARWPLPEAHVPHAIALDEPNRRLFTVTRKPARLIVFDTGSGKAVASLPCVDVNSDMSFDRARRRIYVSGSEATSVFEQRDADHYEHLADVPTAYRAKTSVYVPELNRLYVAASGKGKPEAKVALLIYEAQ